MAMNNPYLYVLRRAKALQKEVQGVIGELPKDAPKGLRGDLQGYTAAPAFCGSNGAYATRSIVMAHINSLNILRHDMKPEEYIKILIKQGQIPKKHFDYKRISDDLYEVVEFNSLKQPTKKVIFDSSPNSNDAPVLCKYYTPDTGTPFKEVRYRRDGNVEIRKNKFDVSGYIKDAENQVATIEELKCNGPKYPPNSNGISNPFADSQNMFIGTNQLQARCA